MYCACLMMLLTCALICGFWITSTLGMLIFTYRMENNVILSGVTLPSGKGPRVPLFLCLSLYCPRPLGICLLTFLQVQLSLYFSLPLFLLSFILHPLPTGRNTVKQVPCQKPIIRMQPKSTRNAAKFSTGY